MSNPLLQPEDSRRAADAVVALCRYIESDTRETQAHLRNLLGKLTPGEYNRFGIDVAIRNGLRDCKALEALGAHISFRMETTTDDEHCRTRTHQ